MNGGISFEEFGQRLKNSTTLRGGEKNPTYQQNTKDRGLTQFFGDMTPAQLETNMKTREHPNQWSAFYVPTLAKLKQQYKENAKPFEEL